MPKILEERSIISYLLFSAKIQIFIQSANLFSDNFYSNLRTANLLAISRKNDLWNLLLRTDISRPNARTMTLHTSYPLPKYSDKNREHSLIRRAERSGQQEERKQNLPKTTRITPRRSEPKRSARAVGSRMCGYGSERSVPPERCLSASGTTICHVVS
jgi:hypothetical protein